MGVVLAESDPIKEITLDILAWKLGKISGAGVHRKHDKYGHVGISIQASDQMLDTIIWNGVEEVIPKTYASYVDIVEDVLFQFADITRSIKGEKVYLTFEIVDISYHPVDYRDLSYSVATCFAIFNCFDKKRYEFDSTRVFRNK